MLWPQMGDLNASIHTLVKFKAYSFEAFIIRIKMFIRI
jgi:hypothetical protein